MYKNIKGSDLKGLIGKINIIDIRKNFLFNIGNIPSSKNIPSPFLLMNPEKYLDNNNTYYIYCSGGLESPKVCLELSNKGYDVVNVLGGYNDYINN